MNPAEAERIARQKVLAMLSTGERKSWTELEKKAREMGMSLRTLRKNLDKCEAAGLVVRLVDTQAKPPRVYYQLKEAHIAQFRRDAALRHPTIAKITDPKDLETWLRFNNEMLFTELLFVIEEAYEEKLVGEPLRIFLDETFLRLVEEYIEELQASGDRAKPVLEKLYEEQVSDFKKLQRKLPRLVKKLPAAVLPRKETQEEQKQAGE